EPPQIDEENFGVPDEMINASIDARAWADAKRAAVAAHASQSENLFFLRFPEDRFAEIFGTEEFVRARPAPTPGEALETDLFQELS
ncbi:MAG TPA: hypothetical protein VFW33_22940, partial [Gemmataceae bacterium]|nr:hypothetical protein [Gemmataceae bacterium]